MSSVTLSLPTTLRDLVTVVVQGEVNRASPHTHAHMYTHRHGVVRGVNVNFKSQFSEQADEEDNSNYLSLLTINPSYNLPQSKKSLIFIFKVVSIMVTLLWNIYKNKINPKNTL